MPAELLAAARRAPSTAAQADHLYLHVPFCAHRCGYCDFVTVTGAEELHERYVDALLTEVRELRRGGAPPATVFVGGGTPTLLRPELLSRLLGGLEADDEVTVECNPETVTPLLARTLVRGGVTRVSLGAQSFRGHLLRTLERRATPEAVRSAVSTLRQAGIQRLNLDLMFGVPGQSRFDLEADLEDALSLRPDHVSAYELEAKPGTRFTHAHGAELQRQAELMEEYYAAVVDRLRSAGYRWYETANFCLPGEEARHNLGYWLGRDYAAAGVGAVSTLGLERRRNRPSVRGYLQAIEAGEAPPADVEQLTPQERGVERLMLGLRLDRPLTVLPGDEALLDPDGVQRMERAGLLHATASTLQLSDRGRFLANDVVATILR